ncbi:MAG: MnmC family methyltransferase [Synechococcaceae cyanobacterium]|nr:MnmC family methyltransferase [Synechococcaceae cyanobacterium]
MSSGAQQSADCADTEAEPISRRTADGSFSLHSPQYGEGFHAASGAVREAREKFIAPAALERFPSGQSLTVLELAVGTATNTAALIEACVQAGLTLRWWGLEIDPRPLRLALADQGFRRQWQPATLAKLTALQRHGGWSQGGIPDGNGVDQGRLLLGDARRHLPALIGELQGRCHLVLHDAFSPQRCPQLWSLELLGGLASLLRPEGRLLTYSAAAAVRTALQAQGLQLASIRPAAGCGGWSAGTAASPTTLADSGCLRPLSAMERDHLRTRAGIPYRDPTGSEDAATIQQRRAIEQQHSSAPSSSAWRRGWQRKPSTDA